MRLYSETPRTLASTYNLSSMTTVGNWIHPRVSLIRRNTLAHFQYQTRMWVVTLYRLLLCRCLDAVLAFGIYVITNDPLDYIIQIFESNLCFFNIKVRGVKGWDSSTNNNLPIIAHKLLNFCLANYVCNSVPSAKVFLLMRETLGWIQLPTVVIELKFYVLANVRGVHKQMNSWTWDYIQKHPGH